MSDLQLRTIALSLFVGVSGCTDGSDDEDTTTEAGSTGMTSTSTSTSGSTSATTASGPTSTTTTDTSSTTSPGATTTTQGSTTDESSDGSTSDASSSSDGSTGSVACVGAANYSITFDAEWDDASVPNRHFSGLIGGVHPPGTRLWTLGDAASAGVQSMAETGASATLRAEVEAQIGNGLAAAVVEGPGIGESPGSAAANFSVSPDAGLISITTMIAPSPDWFAGLDSLDLCDGGEWLQMLSLPAPIFDAGTDSGPDFTSPNLPTEPAEPIAAHATLTDVGTWIIARTN